MSADHAGPAATLAARVRRLEGLLEQRGLVNAGELDRVLGAFLARASPANGARLVARAWLDEGFRARLLADANAALPELGLSMRAGGADHPQRPDRRRPRLSNPCPWSRASPRPAANRT